MLKNRSRLLRYLLTGLLTLVFVATLAGSHGWMDASRSNSPATAEPAPDAMSKPAVAAKPSSPLLRPGANSSAGSLVTRRATTASLTMPFVPNITATLADALQVDNNNSGKADPGDTLMYTVTITNTGTDATGVTFTDDLSQNGGNLTLVPGSVMSAPVARNDSYPNGIGNTRMTVSAANGVLINDFDPDGTTPTAVPITNGNTTLGGKVTLLADGSFTYDPPVGVTATTDTFTYTATDGVKTDTATVSITLTSLVWYVDNTYVGAISDGRSATPFKTLTPVNGAGGAGDADGPGDIIYVVENGGGAYTGGLILETNQQLIGNGVALVVNAQTLAAAGSKPTITNSGGNGITLAGGNTVRGLIAQTTASGGASAGIAGSTVGNLTADTLQAIGNPGAAVDIQTAGTLAVTFESLSSTNGTRGMRLTSATGGTLAVTGATTITGTTGDGVILTNGSPTTNFNGGVSITTASGKGIVANAAGTINVASGSINATGGAALDLTSMNLGTGLVFSTLASTNSTAEGIKMSGCIQNLTATTTNIQTPTGTGIDIQSIFGTSALSFGNTTVNKTAAGTGVNLVSNGTATVSFGALNITTGNGAGLVATTSGTVNATSGTISATGGRGVNIDTVTMSLTMTSVSAAPSGANEGLRFNAATGTFTSPAGTITGATAAAVSVSGSNPTITYGGSVTQNAAARAVDIQGTTGNTVTFNGTVTGGASSLGVHIGDTTTANGNVTFTTLNLGTSGSRMTNQAVTITGGTGTYNLGTASIFTNNAGGIGATNVDGTLNCGSSSVVDSSNATAINIDGPAGLTSLGMSLVSVNSSGGTADGISIQDANGSFTVNGDGTNTALGGNGTGGTISGKSGADGSTANGIGVFLSNVTNITLRRMTITGTNQNFAIRGSSVVGFTFDYSTISGTNGTNDTLNEGSISFSELTGSASFINDNISGGLEDNLVLKNSTGTLNRLTMTGSTIGSNSATLGNAALNMEVSGTGVMNVTVTGCTFTGSRSHFMQYLLNGAGTPTGDLVFTGNTITQSMAAVSGAGGVFVTSGGGGNPTFTFKVQNNIIHRGTQPILGNAINVSKGAGTGNFNGIVDSNTIGTAGVANSGSSQGNGIVIIHLGGGTFTVNLTNNTVRRYNNDGMLVQVGDNTSGGNGTVNATITGNLLAEPDSLALHGLELNIGTTTGDTHLLCATIGGSTAALKNTLTGSGVVANGGFEIRPRQRNSSTIRLPGYGGANNDNNAVATFLVSQNTVTNAAAISASNNVGGGGGGFVGGAACPTSSVSSIVNPFLTESRQANPQTDSPDSDDSTDEGILRVARGEGPYDQNLRELTQTELNWMVQAALARWSEAGLSAEDFARLQAASFELTDLPEKELASINGTHVRIDKLAAGYGWFFDQSPSDDDEFQILVPAKELQAHRTSAARDRIDLLTVVMRELGQIYKEGKDRLPKKMRQNLKPLMEKTLSPGVRRMLLNQWHVTPATTGSLAPETKENLQGQSSATLQADGLQDSLQAIATQIASDAAINLVSPAQMQPTVRYAVYHPATDQTSDTDDLKTEPAVLVNAANVASLARPAVATNPNSVKSSATRARNVAVMGIHEDASETTDLPTVRNVATTTQQTGGKQTKPNVILSGGIVSVGPFNLPAGETVTIMFNATIDTPVVPPGTVQVCTRGAVTYTGGPGGGVLTTDPGPPVVNGATCTTLAQANLAVTKTDTPDPVLTGSNITYTVTATNNGPDTAFNVSLTDAIPANTTFVSTTTPAGWTRTDSVASGGTGTLSFTKPSMANAETAVFTIVVNVNASTLGGTIVTNNAVITSDTPDGTQGNNTGTATTTVQAQADLAVTKIDTPDPVIAGNNITYTINFVNNGQGTAQTVTVTDAVPTNTTFVSAVVTTGTGWTIPSPPAVGGTGNVVFSKPTVTNGETAVFTVVVKVSANTANGATITNTATAASTTTDPDNSNNSGVATTTVNTQADLAVTKTDSPDPVFAGNNITYTVNFTNNGPSDAQTVTVTDAVPAGTTFVSAAVTTGTGWTPSTPISGGTGNVVFSKATVAAAETAVFSIVVKVPASTASGATINNSVTAATATTDPTSSNNTASATTTVQTRADLQVIDLDSPDPVTAGNNLTYTINYVNNGPSDAQSVTMSDPVPANTTFVSAMVTVGTGWTPSLPPVGGTGTVSFTKPTVAGGESGTFQIVVKVNSNTASGTVISNAATMTSATTTDPTPGNNTDTTTTTVNTSADLAITKTDSPDPSFAGNNITYTVTLTNNGPSDAQSVTVTDAVPANTTFVSAAVTTGSGWTPSTPVVGGTGNITFTKSSVAASETNVFTIVVKVDATVTTGTVISNTATVTSSTTDPNSGNNSATATTTIQAQADLSVDKTGSPSPDVVAGTNMTYTINFVNNGPGAATTVTVTDPVPANATFVSAMVTTGTGWTPTLPSVGGTGNVVFSKATVANGETAVFQVVVKINSSTPNNTTITNTATVAATTADPDSSNNTDAVMTNAIRQIDLSVTKTDSPDPVNAGNDITYTINFSNAGPSDASNVTVTDTLPGNASFVSAMVTTGTGWTTTTPAGQVVFSKGAVTAGESAVFTIVVHVPSNTANGATVSNSVATAATETDTGSGNNSASATTTVQTRADLMVTKTDSPDPVNAGNDITYTINFSNLGPSDAQTVTVTDAVPAGTTFVSAMVTTGSGWSVNTAGPIVFSKATVVAGENAVFTMVVHVPASASNGATISNSVTAASATTDPVAGNNTAMASTTVQTRADLAVTKTDTPDPAFAGSNITYTVNFVNNGPSDAQTVTVTDAVPANTTFVSAVVTTGTGWTIPSPPAVGGTGNVVFSKATVAASETAVFTIVVKVNANTTSGTVISNTATAVTATTDPTPGNNSATATTTIQTNADLAVTKTDSPDPVIAGNNITYTINLINNGPSDAQTVTVTDAVPANTTFVSAVVTTGTGWTIPSPPAVGGTGNVVFSKPTVTNGETAVFTIVVKVNANTANGATITNSAVAAATTGDGTSANNTATATTAVQTSADLIVTKTDSPDPVIAGNNITYTINFNNAGPSDAQTVTVTDTVPAGTSFVSAMVTTGTGWSVNTAGPIVFSKATVAASEAAVFTLIVKVNANVANGSTISNSAVAASTTSDPTPANNTGNATTTVQTQADLAVTKTDSPDPVFAGANITYTINFNNNGPSDAQTVMVTDAVPANCTFVSATVTTGTGWTPTLPAVGGTGNVVFSKATVAASEAAVFTMVVKVNSNVANGSTINNSATASSATTDPTPGNNTGTASTAVQTSADIAVVKTDSPDPVVASQNLTYTINFTNNGPSDAQTVSITDAVPANTTFVSATVTTGTGWTKTEPAVGGTGNVVFSKATVAAGETAVFTIIVKVNASTPHNTTITNTATATTTTTDPTSGNNTSTTTTTVIAQADLAVTKSDTPDPVCASSDITYTINFVDNGPGPGLGTTVTDAVPANTTFVSATVTTGTGWTKTEPAVGGTGNVVFSKANVAIGETATFTIVVRLNDGVVHGTVITNSVTAASTIPDPTPGNNTAMTTTTVDPIAPTITCPANITQSTDANLCSAVVNYAAPTVTENCPCNTPAKPKKKTAAASCTVVCSPTSGSIFPKGTTTVTCTATDTSGNTASCSFTVTVNDTQPPSVTCPNNVTTKTAHPGDPCVIVNYPTPAGSDNCPGVAVVCNPPSGSCFALGTTTVTCTATDTSGNTASCTFVVGVYDLCIQSDSVPGNVVLVNSVTGDYRFCCNGVTFTGRGTMTIRGSLFKLEHNASDRRVLVSDDESTHKGTATLQAPPGTNRCTIIDNNTQNNSCTCQ